MKKINIIITSIFMFCILLTGCGSSAIKNNAMTSMPSFDVGVNGNYGNYYDEMEEAAPEEGMVDSESSSTDIPDTSRKLIKRYNYSFRSTEFDKSYENILKALDECEGYMEESSLNSSGNRYFEATLRIPEKNIDKFLANTDSYGKVYDTYMTTEDVTLNYVDTESKISSLKIEYERIEALLMKADTIESIIQLESRLEEIRYELQNYESMIRTYDNLISYVTVNLSLREVAVETATQNDNMFTRMWTEFLNSISDISYGTQELLILLVGSIPYIVIFGIIGLISFKIYKKKNNKKLPKIIEKVDNEEKKDV